MSEGVSEEESGRTLSALLLADRERKKSGSRIPGLT